MSKLNLVVGDLFDAPQKFVGHGVNTKGAMGAGIAKIFSSRNPAMYQFYREQCHNGGLQPGGVLTLPSDDGSYMVVNLASQEFPGANAKIALLISSITEFANEQYDATGERADLAIPLIDCGVGGLKWSMVRLALEALADTLSDQLTITVYSQVPFDQIEE